MFWCFKNGVTFRTDVLQIENRCSPSLDWSINWRLEKTVAEVTLSPIRGGRSSFFALLAGARGAGAEGWALNWPEMEPPFHSCPEPAAGPHPKMLLLNQSGFKAPLIHSPWVCGPSGFSQWGVLLSPPHLLIKVILGRSASPSFPTKQQAGEEMQTSSCDSAEGLRWKPLVELRCHFGCHNINPGRQEKGGDRCLFLPSGQGEGDFIPLCLPPLQTSPQGRSRLAKLALPKCCEPGKVPLEQPK